MLSRDIAERIRQASFSDTAATVIGCGTMGTEFVKALQVLGVPSIRVCARRLPQFERLNPDCEIRSFEGGYAAFSEKAAPNELAIIAIPTAELIPAARRLMDLGFRRFLIEKPLSFYSCEIGVFQKECAGKEIEIFCAYNRIAYPSFLEAKGWIEREGGATSCNYTMTEILNPKWPEIFSAEELSRWGIANSLHVASMAHGLIGLPREWRAFRGGKPLAWHPAGSVFTGAGVSDRGIPFSYHGDWGSTGRWSVEVHTATASYLFCPLEKLQRRTSFREPWTEIPMGVFDARIKAGIAEETAAALKSQLRSSIPLYSPEATLRLTRFGEEVFGYDG